MTKRRTAAIACIIGAFGFMMVARNPRFDTIRTVDVLQLITSGMCFGIALMALLGRLKARSKE